MKKIFTLMMAMTLMASTAFATTIYCKMEHGWWKADGAAVGAYAWTGEGQSAQSNANWPGVRMTPTNQADVWAVDIDSQYEKIIFTRVNGSGDVADWGAKTKDLVIPTDGKNLFTITTSTAVWGDPGCDGEWSVLGDEPGPGPGPGPQPAGDKDYYLMGNVDGTQAGDITVPTANELFECGVLPYPFSGGAGQKGYFFVMVCDAGAVVGEQYMLMEYKEGTHATLYHQPTTGAGQKLGVAAGNVTFYLYDNEDGTLELSVEPILGKKLVGGCEEQAVENTIVNEKARKQIIDGQLRIIRGDKIYDATGRQL